MHSWIWLRMKSSGNFLNQSSRVTISPAFNISATCRWISSALRTQSLAARACCKASGSSLWRSYHSAARWCRVVSSEPGWICSWWRSKSRNNWWYRYHSPGPLYRFPDPRGMINRLACSRLCKNVWLSFRSKTASHSSGFNRSRMEVFTMKSWISGPCWEYTSSNR